MNTRPANDWSNHFAHGHCSFLRERGSWDSYLPLRDETLATIRDVPSRQSRLMGEKSPEAVMPNRRSMSSFTPATWRGTTSVNRVTGAEMGVSFDTADGVVRLLLPVHYARHLAESVLEQLEHYEDSIRTNSQSETSLGNPSVDVSMPEEGENV